jgi:HPt (histidine-containing phosphotransfer) domain-containing protein
VASELTEGLSAASLAKFKVLQHHFVAGLAARWRAVADAATPPELQAELHRLSGAAGSYGFDRLSQCARAAELSSTGAAKPALAQALALVEAEINLAQTLVQEGSSTG